jgi:hypothetical protein
MNKIFLNIVFLLLLVTTFIFLHELTHKTIYEKYGCTDIEQGYENFRFYTSAICTDKDVTLAQSIAEIVGYNIMPFLVILVFVAYTRD